MQEEKKMRLRHVCKRSIKVDWNCQLIRTQAVSKDYLFQKWSKATFHFAEVAKIEMTTIILNPAF